MKLFSKINWLPTSIAVVTLLIVFGLNAPKPVFAAQKQSKDTTVSASDVQFTDIPTAADSIAIRKKAMEAKQAAASAAATTEQAVKIANHASKSTLKGAPESVWAIFIAGFLQGLLAVLMPCIYPLLPLTVSFFTKKVAAAEKE